MAVGRGERSFASELGDGLLGAGVVHELLAIGGGRDESGGGGIVERAGDAVGEAVQASEGVVGEELVGATGEGEVVSQVGGGVTQVHVWEVEACGDAPVESGEDAEAQLA